jgi:hypothetical protein
MSTGHAAVRTAGPKGTINIPKKDINNKIKINKFAIGGNASAEFINQTGGNVRVWIPKGDKLFVPPAGVQNFDESIDVPPSGLTLSILANAIDGIYHYSAYCDAIKDFAEGNSAPEISCP